MIQCVVHLLGRAKVHTLVGATADHPHLPLICCNTGSGYHPEMIDR